MKKKYCFVSFRVSFSLLLSWRYSMSSLPLEALHERPDPLHVCLLVYTQGSHTGLEATFLNWWTHTHLICNLHRVCTQCPVRLVAFLESWRKHKESDVVNGMLPHSFAIIGPLGNRTLLGMGCETHTSFRRLALTRLVAGGFPDQQDNHQLAAIHHLAQCERSHSAVWMPILPPRPSLTIQCYVRFVFDPIL